MPPNWKQQHADDAELALEHELVQRVIDEFVDNVYTSVITIPQELFKYGLFKIASVTAQVARAQALNIDPDSLRMTDDEHHEYMKEIWLGGQ